MERHVGNGMIPLKLDPMSEVACHSAKTSDNHLNIGKLEYFRLIILLLLEILQNFKILQLFTNFNKVR